MPRISISLLSTMMLASSAFAGSAPTLPATAKKLTGPEIVAAFDKKTLSFVNFTKDKSLTGTNTYDFTAKTVTGTYVYGDKDKGNFSVAIKIKNDMYCWTPDKQKDNCENVFSDISGFYDVDAKGKVLTLQKPQ